MHQKTQRQLPQFVEVELVKDNRPGPHAVFEIWSMRRIYSVDLSMRCFRVFCRKTNEYEPRNPCIGARLVGGQRKLEGKLEVSFPCPKPGLEGVFEIGNSHEHITTSLVERVVFRIRIVQVFDDPPWEEISSRFLMEID